MNENNILRYRGPSTPTLCVNEAQHRNALAGRTTAHGRAMMKMLTGWQEYADAHAERFEGGIGQDYLFGPYWAEIGLAIKRLLDGEAGGLDCGSIAANILDAINAQGIENDGYTLTEKE